jgi:hypothetical protein
VLVNDDKLVRLSGYEYISGHGFRKSGDRAVVDVEKMGAAGYSLTCGGVSPSGRWLAIGLHGPRPGAGKWERDRRLIIWDLEQGRVAFQAAETDSYAGHWFAWRGGDRLRFQRPVGTDADGETLLQILELSPLDWKGSEHAITQADLRSWEARVEPLPPGDEERKEAACRRLERLGYLSYSTALFWTPGFLDGRMGEVSPDGKAIATLVDAGMGRAKFILVRQKKGWIEEGLPAPRGLWMVQFWKEWVVIGEADMEPEKYPGWEKEPRIYREVNKRIRLFHPEDSSRSFECRAYLFLPGK